MANVQSPEIALAGDAPKFSATFMLKSILSMIRDDTEVDQDGSECVDFGVHTFYDSRSGTGEILQDISFLRKEIVNAREDILVDKLETLQKRNSDLHESLQEAIQTIHQLSRSQNAVAVHCDSKKLSLPIYRSFNSSNRDEGDDDDDAISQQTTSRTAKLRVDSVQGSESDEMQVENSDPDLLCQGIEACASVSSCSASDMDFQWSKDEKIFFLLQVP